MKRPKPTAATPDPTRLPSRTALFRHHVISEVEARVLGGEALVDAVLAIAAEAHPLEKGRMRTVSARTLYRWRALWTSGGLVLLEPAARRRTTTSIALPPPLVDFLRVEKGRDPEASVPELLRRAALSGLIEDALSVDRVTAWRACRRMALPLGGKQSKRAADARRFAFPHRMMMVFADGKYFRAGARRTRRIALFFIDDATRRVLGVVVGPSGESSALFLRGLYEVVRRFGLMDVVFLDRGPGFIADDTRRVLVALGKHLVLGRARYPQGHGKIERFNQTAWDDVLRGFDGAVEIDDACGALELRLGHYIEEQYNLRPHESLGGVCPRARWDADERALVWPESDAALREAFVLPESRKVSGDHIVKCSEIAYEVPRGLRLTWIVVRRNVLDGTVSISHEGKLVRLHPVDLAANATAGRARGEIDPEPERTPPVTAAAMAFLRDLGPVVTSDGGCPDPIDPIDPIDPEDDDHGCP